MSEREDFLSRWSRRKRDAEKESAPEQETKQPEAEAAPPIVDEAAPAQPADIAESAADVSESADNQDKKEKVEPAFDLSKLPSLDSITAETDIRPFMAAGVPLSLRQAALRRVWVADPTIRDFIGIAENQWDFTPGGNAPGFDFSPPTGDVQRMVAEIFGGGQRKQSDELAESDDKLPPREEPKSVRWSDSEPQPEADQLEVTSSAEDRDRLREQDTDEVSSADAAATGVQEEDVASQNNDAEQNETVRIAAHRPHGGAMPK